MEHLGYKKINRKVRKDFYLATSSVNTKFSKLCIDLALRTLCFFIKKPNSKKSLRTLRLNFFSSDSCHFAYSIILKRYPIKREAASQIVKQPLIFCKESSNSTSSIYKLVF